MKKLVTTLVLGATMVTLQACNTIDGAVDDVESVGDCADGREGNC
jgi:predicted small secreted protein